MLTFPMILKERKFYPADRKMQGRIDYKILNFWINIDLDQFRPGLAFSFLREFAGRDVYFRRFDKSKLKFDTSIDIGANNGFVTEVFAIASAGKGKIISVEPLYNSELYTKNLLERHPNVIRIEKAVLDDNPESAKYLEDLVNLQDLATTTIERIYDDYSIEKVNFMKIDIEGGEFSMFRETKWLDSVENLVMEVHEGHGNPVLLTDALVASGFSVACTDNFGNTVPASHVDYLYASRNGALVRDQ